MQVQRFSLQTGYTYHGTLRMVGILRYYFCSLELFNLSAYVTSFEIKCHLG